MKVVSLFGIGLFVLAVIVQATLAGSVFWHLSLLESGRYVNVAGSFLLIVLAAILPPVAAYFIGDKSTKNRSQYEHHYNGVLFALLSVWITLAVTVYIVPAIPMVTIPYVTDEFNKLWPAVVAVIVAIAIGITYGHKRHQVLLHEYLPFQVALITPLAALVASSAIGTVAELANPLPSAYGMLMLVPLFVMGLMLVVPLILSAEKSLMGKLTEAVLAASVGLFAVMIASQIPFFGLGIGTDIIIPALAGLVTWLAYLYYYYYRKTD